MFLDFNVLCPCFPCIIFEGGVLAFELQFTADRGKSVTHFLFLHIFGKPYYRVIGDYIKKGRMCASVVLWCNVWVMNVRKGRVKEKPCVSISLHFKKRNDLAARFNVCIRWTNHYYKNICPYNTCNVGGIWDLRQVHFGVEIFWDHCHSGGHSINSLIIRVIQDRKLIFAVNNSSNDGKTRC